MKTHIENLFSMPVLLAALGLMLAGQGTAQTFMTLHSFTAISGREFGPHNNTDGAYPSYFVL
jgi:hypothetical protein